MVHTKIMDHNLLETQLSKFTVNREECKITMIKIIKVLVRKMYNIKYGEFQQKYTNYKLEQKEKGHRRKCKNRNTFLFM